MAQQQDQILRQGGDKTVGRYAHLLRRELVVAQRFGIGVGRAQLKRFYKYHFIGANPPDMELVPVSRTIGTDQLVDEMVIRFTHTAEIDWMLPGVAPTGKYVEIAMVAIISFRGDKLYHEHIYWDQASVLVQVGLLDPALLPVAGVETARKLLDETLPSNELLKR